jgi:non-specific serine/threonine protein kinase
LAIELAVARLRVLTPEQIRDRLADAALLTRGRRTAPVRQQTLRGCIKWSHDLCTPDERLLWARLSVFAGDFDLDAAEGVAADAPLSAGDVLELVTSLVEKSILVRAQEQDGVVGYRMLESIRTYGRERLGESRGAASLRRRHRDWHQHLVARFQAEWIGPGQRDSLRYLDRRMPDISAALEISLSDPGQSNAALAMAGDLHMFWGVRGFHHQARYWLTRALTSASEPSPARLKALFFATAFAGQAGDLAAGDEGQQARHHQSDKDRDDPIMLGTLGKLMAQDPGHVSLPRWIDDCKSRRMAAIVSWITIQAHESVRGGWVETRPCAQPERSAPSKK